MRTLLLSVLLLLGSVSLKAQSSLSTKDIKGNWKMVAFDMAGIYYEWGIDSMSFSRTLNDMIQPGQEADVKAEMKQKLDPYKEGTVVITEDHYAQDLMGEQAEGTYTLIQKGNTQYLRIVNNNKYKDIDELNILKKKGRLYLSTVTEDGVTTLIFERD